MQKAQGVVCGQWTYVSAARCTELGLEHGNACVNKITKCHEWAGVGRGVGKRSRAEEGSSLEAAAIGRPIGEEICPPIVQSIDEIWGKRCAACFVACESD